MRNKRILWIFVLGSLLSGQLSAKDYLISTSNTSLLLTAEPGEKSLYRYYGTRIEAEDIQGLYDSGRAFTEQSYPVFGLNTSGERAMAVAHADGNMTLDLVVETVKQYTEPDGEVTEIRMKDKVYPFVLKQMYKAYKGTDVISTWIEVDNIGKKPVVLYRFASAFFPVRRGDNWLTHFHGSWAAEHQVVEEKMTSGQKIISDKNGLVNSHQSNPSFMITLDGKPDEEHGHVFGGTLAWAGNFLLKADVKNTSLTVSAEINEDMAHYVLEGGETFVLPEFAMTYSICGKGGVSRAFHRWARMYKLQHGDVERDILLNSWEGVYFNVNQSGMNEMMTDFSDLGGELFVMDDGWFGEKYPRDKSDSSLGDWVVCKKKLPEGIEGLLDSAEKNNLKFGLWIEPEMTNTRSELFERHPDWVLQVPGRPRSTGRGGTQLVLDLTNPEVQDFVFGVVDRLMTQYPRIAYMKWDDNCGLMDYGSKYLPADRQSHIYIEYHKGLKKVLERIRSKYPQLVLQLCAGGGGRVNYGLLPYFDEFWTSDDTDALQRIYMQWGVSNFYPAIAMGAHVSAKKNHQTGRVTPLKFRFDVAMSGRLGMEMQPKDMSVEEKTFAKRAIAAYKTIRPVVQFGDLYRLASPYDKQGLASLMYVTPEKDRAVFYAYKLEHFVNMTLPDVRLNGLNPDKHYRIKDLTPVDEKKPCYLDGKVFRGAVLMDGGLPMNVLLKDEYSSQILMLQQID